jgi:hypothetical protein
VARLDAREIVVGNVNYGVLDWTFLKQTKSRAIMRLGNSEALSLLVQMHESRSVTLGWLKSFNVLGCRTVNRR